MGDAADGGGDDTTSVVLIQFLQRILQPLAWIYSHIKPSNIMNYLDILQNKHMILVS